MTNHNTSPAGPIAPPDRADARDSADHRQGHGARAVNGNDAAADLGADRGRGAEIILIPKHLRMEWTDVMALDPDLPASAFKVACVIGSHFNRRSGDTFVRQDTIAEVMRLALRTVRAAIGELERRGYPIVGRRELGIRESDGRRVCGGRGVANTYVPALDGRQVAATNAGKRLAARADEAWAERRQRAASFEQGKEAMGCLLSEDERRQSGVGKEAMGCLPTLNDPSDHNPARASAGARRVAPAPARNHPLGAAAEELARRIGPLPFATWFAEVRPLGAAGGVLTLAVPSPFIRDRLINEWLIKIADSWNAAHPKAEKVARVEFAVVKQGGRS